MSERQAGNIRHSSRGIALIATLLLLSLFTVMTLAMVIATTSDTLIDGYYRNFRSSFYAADSGLNAARQYMINQLNSAVPSPYVPYSGAPISAGTETTIISNLTNTSTGFGSNQSITGSQTDSWPAEFKIDATNTSLGTPTCVVQYTGTTAPLPTCTSAGSSSDTVTSYAYTYPYKITVIGEARRNEQNTVVETGSFIVNAVITSSTTTQMSFASWGTLFDQYSICSSPFVAGTMSGPFFSNDSWNFGDTGLVGSSHYIFTGSVGAAASNVGYMYSDGTCDQKSTTSDSHRGTTINPTFQSGLNLGQPEVPLPQDAYNQQRAVLDGLGACSVSPCPSVTQAQRAAALRNAAGTAWPSSGSEPATGVYLPYSTSTTSSCSTAPCFTGGGIYVQGNADSITVSAANPVVTGVTHSQQVFAIKQGAKTTTVTVDMTSNKTTISDGTNSQIITGIPENLNTGTEAVMLFDNGNISGTSGQTTTGLSGPSSGAAIQDASALTITATGTIAVTGSLTYKAEPVTFAQNGSTPADTLIPANDTKQVLGLFTPTGDIQLRVPNSGQNLEIDASLAMISNAGSGGMINTWNQIGTLTIVGGRIANQAKQGNISTRNIWFDKRFGSNNFAPPWFPSTNVTTTGVATATVTVSPSRVSWIDTTAM